MMVYTDVVQRLRLIYHVDEPLCYISVLDMGNLWERLLRRADLPVAYTQGYHPHPRLQFASPLPVGYRSRGEVLDIYMGRELQMDTVRQRITAQSPRGLTLRSVHQVPAGAPNLQAMMREAEYRVQIWTEASAETIQAAIDELLARDSLPRQRQRKGRTQQYDLRPLIHKVAYLKPQPDAEGDLPCHLLHIRTRSGSQGSGRPEEIIQELDPTIAHHRIYRTKLIWEGRQEDVR